MNNQLQPDQIPVYGRKKKLEVPFNRYIKYLFDMCGLDNIRKKAKIS